jgi:hypothetical protein
VFRYTFGGMADDAAGRVDRREYGRRYAQARRAAARRGGARRIEVALKDDTFDNYATVRRHIERSPTAPPRRRRVSDTDVITWALKEAAN